MQAINLLPYDLYMYGEADVALAGFRYVVRPGAEPIVFMAKVGLRHKENAQKTATSLVSDKRVPLFGIRFELVTELPPPKPGTILVVKRRTAMAARFRKDVFFPGPAVFDGQGEIIGCLGLARDIL